MLILLRGDVRIESRLTTAQPLLPILRLQLRIWVWEVGRCFASSFEPAGVQLGLHSLVVGTGKQVHSVHLRI